jgi:hypothetical protein
VFTPILLLLLLAAGGAAVLLYVDKELREQTTDWLQDTWTTLRAKFGSPGRPSTTPSAPARNPRAAPARPLPSVPASQPRDTGTASPADAARPKPPIVIPDDPDPAATTKPGEPSFDDEPPVDDEPTREDEPARVEPSGDELTDPPAQAATRTTPKPRPPVRRTTAPKGTARPATKPARAAEPQPAADTEPHESKNAPSGRRADGDGDDDVDPTPPEPPEVLAKHLYDQAIDAEGEDNWAAAVKAYGQIKRLPRNVWPSDLELRLRIARSQLTPEPPPAE